LQDAGAPSGSARLARRRAAGDAGHGEPLARPRKAARRLMREADTMPTRTA